MPAGNLGIVTGQLAGATFLQHPAASRPHPASHIDPFVIKGHLHFRPQIQARSPDAVFIPDKIPDLTLDQGEH
jgi:hypothetical protein